MHWAKKRRLLLLTLLSLFLFLTSFQDQQISSASTNSKEYSDQLKQRAFDYFEQVDGQPLFFEPKNLPKQLEKNLVIINEYNDSSSNQCREIESTVNSQKKTIISISGTLARMLINESSDFKNVSQENKQTGLLVLSPFIFTSYTTQAFVDALLNNQIFSSVKNPQYKNLTSTHILETSNNKIGAALSTLKSQILSKDNKSLFEIIDYTKIPEPQTSGIAFLLHCIWDEYSMNAHGALAILEDPLEKQNPWKNFIISLFADRLSDTNKGDYSIALLLTGKTANYFNREFFQEKKKVNVLIIGGDLAKTLTAKWCSPNTSCKQSLYDNEAAEVLIAHEHNDIKKILLKEDSSPHLTERTDKLRTVEHVYSFFPRQQ